MISAALGVLLLTGALSAQTMDFESAELGAPPAGWESAMTHQGGAPRWEVRRDPTAPSGDKVLAQLSNDRSGGRYPLAIYTKADLRDAELRVKIKPVSGKIDASGGLVWRYRDANNYYVVRLNALEDNVVLYKVEKGKRSALAPLGAPPGTYGVKQTVPARAWTALGVSFRGSRFTVFYNGRKLFEVEDATFPGAGKVGLWTKADAVTHFDDFEIIQ